MIHRDIKPGNVLLTSQGIPKLGDFGLAQHNEGAERMTIPGSQMGTMYYASPEQLVSGRNADSRSDIYGLGATLYAMLTDTAPRMVRLDLIDPAFQEVVKKCLEEHPDSRYQGR